MFKNLGYVNLPFLFTLVRELEKEFLLKINYKFEDEDFLRISNFLGHAEKLFNNSDFIKTFEILNLVLYIHRENTINKLSVNFKDLKKYLNRSDVYLANKLKDGLLTGYLKVEVPSSDKRIRNYSLEKKSFDFMTSLNFTMNVKDTT